MKQIWMLCMSFIFCGALFGQPAQMSLSEKVKVTFPGTPDSMTIENGAKMFLYKKDSTKKILSSVSIDLAGYGLSAEMVASMGDGLWDQIKSPMLAQMGSVDIIKDEIIQFKGKSCLKVELDISKANSSNVKGKKMYMLCFFVGSVLNQLNYATSTDNSKEDAEAFFNTLSVE
ncbi:MAG: hypothetical protein WCH59_13260 [Chitinophagia bacterium]